MTALERAEQIAKYFYLDDDTEARDTIHRAIIEHSNGELERRRAVEKELNSLMAVISENPLLAAAVKRALLLKASEGRDV